MLVEARYQLHITTGGGGLLSLLLASARQRNDALRDDQTLELWLRKEKEWSAIEWNAIVSTREKMIEALRDDNAEATSHHDLYKSWPHLN